jgi:hypothetical protein
MRTLPDAVWPAAAALAVRLVLWGTAAPHPNRLMIETDPGEYVRLARNLAPWVAALKGGFERSDRASR